jgi:outer membrane protein assembly factor BamB
MTARHLVGGELWCTGSRTNEKFDLATGRKVSDRAYCGLTYASANLVGGCIPPIAVGGRYVTQSRGGGCVDLAEFATGKPGMKAYTAARGACVTGMVPGNGMLYTGQNGCNCFAQQIGGFLALGPWDGDGLPSAECFTQARPVEKGPAFGDIAPAAAGGWPTFRGGVERGAGTASGIPVPLRPLWTVSLADKTPGPFLDAWRSRYAVAQPLGAPVIGEGVLLVPRADCGQIVAMKPETGDRLWTSSLGGRIDTPPTIHRGLALVGCGDGWVYALRLRDGALAYRLRVAPAERLMVAHALVESVWPVVGSVLVHDGLAYATAGRCTLGEGGIAVVAFKPETGETVWAKPADATPGGAMKNTVLCIRDGELAWHWHRMDPKTGNRLPNAQMFHAGRGGMLDFTWASGGGKSGKGHMLGKACANMMAWNESLLVFPGTAVKRSAADAPKPDPKATPIHPPGFKPDETVWKTNLEPNTGWATVRAMAVTGNAALFGGVVYNGYAGGKHEGSFLWVKSAQDGKTLQERIRLDADPIVDGLAVCDGRVFLALDNGSVACWGAQDATRTETK